MEWNKAVPGENVLKREAFPAKEQTMAILSGGEQYGWPAKSGSLPWETLRSGRMGEIRTSGRNGGLGGREASWLPTCARQYVMQAGNQIPPHSN